ncbi:MAG: hypothetical protein QNJ13_11660 [Paracoccaceae bacterium]|nr:hypothetical protein [Paracoccaceae bacterium]
MSLSVQPLTLVSGPAVPAVAPPRKLPAVRETSTDFPAEVRGCLGPLRLAALGCRSAARFDVFDGCARLAGASAPSAEEVARTLVRALPEALGQRPVLHRPGVGALTFDEAWLLRVLAARCAGDDHTLAFLLNSRVAPAMVRQIAFLAGALTEAGVTA